MKLCSERGKCLINYTPDPQKVEWGYSGFILTFACPSVCPPVHLSICTQVFQNSLKKQLAVETVQVVFMEYQKAYLTAFLKFLYFHLISHFYKGVPINFSSTVNDAATKVVYSFKIITSLFCLKLIWYLYLGQYSHNLDVIFYGLCKEQRAMITHMYNWFKNLNIVM